MYVLVLYDPNKVLFNFFKISRNLVKCVNLSGVNLSGTTVSGVYYLLKSSDEMADVDGENYKYFELARSAKGKGYLFV